MLQNNNRPFQLRHRSTNYDAERQETVQLREKKEISLFNAQLPVIRDLSIHPHDQ